MGWQEPETARRGDPVASRAHGKLRAADADRDRAAGMLGAAYSEGRLSRDEHDARLDAALSARTYADLDQVLTDLPAEHATPVSPAGTSELAVSARTSGLAVASLACGLAQFIVGPLATIPAIVLGYLARSRIRRTGEAGAGLALAGMALGWAVVILGIALILMVLLLTGGMHGPMRMH
jgi:DUF1707 SHOCT-like domain/Domain of unknown function (DUF4190)